MRGRSRCPGWSFCRRRSLLVCGLFGVACFYLFLSLMLYSRDLADSDTQQIQERIIGLSKQYVKALASDKVAQRHAPDFQKPLAVLIDNLVERVDYLETKVNALSHGRIGVSKAGQTWNESDYRASLEDESSYSKVMVVAKPDHIETKPELHVDEKMQGECSYTAEDIVDYPNCANKAQWLRQFWKSDKCYSLHGVDGTDCSFFIYLSEFEKWCPRFSWRPKEPPPSQKSGPMAAVSKDKEGLFAIMDNPEKFRWMKMRISRMWGKLWIPAVEALEARGELAGRTQKKILIHLGLLTKESGFKIAEKAFSGGPLGELVQWSDIITSQYILGHEINLSYSTHRLKTLLQDEDPRNVPRGRAHSILRSGGLAKSSCPTESGMPFDIIYIDIVGLKQMRKATGGIFSQFKCMLRVIDTFGTEPAYNSDSFSRSTNHRSSWGKWNLVPRQFMTMFPHTPDNSFMGFVVEHYPSKVSDTSTTRELRALVYGKDHKMWEDQESYLNMIHEKFEIHGTVFFDESSDKPQTKLPSYVHNHGFINGSDLQQVLHKTKLFVGLGFPYEGPAPLEAIANGCIFLNPSFDPPKNSKNTKFFEGKPTTRAFSSQHPYAEMFIGKPHVWTVDITDKNELRRTIQEIREIKAIEPYLPYEYTCEGMLQRVSAYTQHQDYCVSGGPMWPPASALQIIPADENVSCKQACTDLGLVCEPSFFPIINKKEIIEEHFSTTCSVEDPIEDIFPPSLKAGRFRNRCHIQRNDILFSCAGEKAGVRRLCPCRDFIKGQVALCKDCL